MIKATLCAALTLFIWLVLYAVGAVASWDFNPGNWHYVQRGFLAILCLSGLLVSIAHFYVREGEK